MASRTNSRFLPHQLAAVDPAIRRAEIETRWEISVYVGDLASAPAEAARDLHSRLLFPRLTIQVTVDPELRTLEIVPGDRTAPDPVGLHDVVDVMCGRFAADTKASGLTQGLVDGLGLLPSTIRRAVDVRAG